MKKYLWVHIAILIIIAVSACNPLKASPTASSGASPTSTGPTQDPTQIAIPVTSSTSTPPQSPTSVANLPAPQYYYPLPNAKYVSENTTLIVRYGPEITQQAAAGLKISAQGAKSGAHTGHIVLADDRRTIIFSPDQPFTSGEQVQVQIDSFHMDAQTTYLPLAYTFTVSVSQQSGSLVTATPTAPAQNAFPNYLTVPKDIPHFTVSKTSPDTGEGDIFVAPFYWKKSTVGTYLLILDNQGQLVYYQSLADELKGYDFKLLPNGMISYYGEKDATIYWMDSHYQVVNTFQSFDGYIPDLHDSLLLPNGNLVVMVNDIQGIDMSQVVKGGNPQASVYGLALLELDPSKNVVWVWRSWDHVAFTDSTADLTVQGIDLVHGNGLALANDGNLLLSSRNLSEITKINLQTGEVIWRLGGKANMFKFTNDQGFAFQHNITQLPNGDITLFDNHGTDQNPAASRAVEYQVDETNKTVTKVWEYIHNPPVFTDFMGDVQRLANGNTFISWGDDFNAPGYALSSITEVTPNNQTVFELTFDQPYVSYRAFRFPWKGDPLTQPSLAYQQDGGSLTLGYSWNGATEVAAWRVYGGNATGSLTLIDTQAKSQFETQSHLSNLPAGECYFQAAAIDQSGNEMARSPIVSTDSKKCPD